jgi:hypothetical protein
VQRSAGTEKLLQRLISKIRYDSAMITVIRVVKK